MGSFLSSLSDASYASAESSIKALSSLSTHPGNQFLFQPPQRNTYDMSSSNHTNLIKENKYCPHMVPVIHIKAMKKSFNDFTKPNRCIIYSHGNAADLYVMKDYLKILSQSLNIDVIGYDYTGYGYTQSLTTEKPSQSGCVRSLRNVVSYAKDAGYDDIILMGSSVGTGVTLEYIKEIGGFDGKVILESPFTSVFSIINESSQNSIMDMFVNIENIKYVRKPAFILHGDADEVVPFSQGQELYKVHSANLLKSNQSPYDPWWMNGTGHNNIVHFHGVPVYMKKLGEYVNA